MEMLDTSVVYWHWIALGFLLAAVEILVPSFFMLWFGVSAILVGTLSFFIPMPFALELLIWGLLSLACLVVWFKFVSPKMKDATKSGMGREALIGQVGTVLEYNVSSTRGMLRFPAPLLGEDEWRFISPEPLSSGDKVIVTDTSGNDLIVKINK